MWMLSAHACNYNVPALAGGKRRGHFYAELCHNKRHGYCQATRLAGVQKKRWEFHFSLNLPRSCVNPFQRCHRFWGCGQRRQLRQGVRLIMLVITTLPDFFTRAYTLDPLESLLPSPTPTPTCLLPNHPTLIFQSATYSGCTPARMKGRGFAEKILLPPTGWQLHKPFFWWFLQIVFQPIPS